MASLSRRSLANAIRALSMDAVQKANSGHPGAPMGMADVAEVLWRDCMVHNPGDPGWVNRDRFVLSNGHASMLLYALLHLTGYPLSIEEIKAFRQLDSKTPGHPEYGHTEGVETTTGPLGQGLGNAVGMALAEQILAEKFNREDFPIIDHYTYVFLGDGCLMEGISHEVSALAGTLKLGKLIAVWDDNGISIDGAVEPWFSEDVCQRYKSYGWEVLTCDGHNAEEIYRVLAAAKKQTEKPTFIQCKTTIGYGSPNKAGQASCHGAPLGEAEVASARAALDWPYPAFEIPEAHYAAWDMREVGNARQKTWQTLFDRYEKAHPDLASELSRRLSGTLSEAWASACERLATRLADETAPIATRKASQKILDELSEVCPEWLGGSADLTGSNLTWHQRSEAITPEHRGGNYIHYGVREFGMAAIMNGLALHGGFIPYGGTFLTFLDYMRNAVRMSALMGQRCIYVFSHDSIGLGEDGPTHQPVEHISMLRATPGMYTFRPCDASETLVAWREAMARTDGPSSLLLSRQGLPAFMRTKEVRENMARGGYVLKDCEGLPEVILLATGSEVALCVAAYEQLLKAGVAVRVVSLLCVELFEAQPSEYRDKVLPPNVKVRVAVEAGSTLPWYRYVGPEGYVLGIDQFGASAPNTALFEHYGLTTERVLACANTCLSAAQTSQ